MDRFAFRINAALKQNLYSTCRLCGIDYPEKVPILSEVPGDGEPQLSEKIQECIGFIILKDDKMPQSACNLCVDKINDFYEFREMCFTTNTQMRKLLGLKSEQLRKGFSHNDLSITNDPILVGKPNRKRQSYDDNVMVDYKINFINVQPDVLMDEQAELSIPESKKLRMSKTSTTGKQNQKLSPVGKLNEKSELKNSCMICNQRFSNKVQLKHHLNIMHVPNIPRFFCTACDEAIVKAIDIKNHQLWHKLSKTPYACPLCRKSPSNMYAYTRHMKDHCQEQFFTEEIPDRRCPQCCEHFKTIFLYNTHPCATQLKKCAGCQRQLKNKGEYLKHAASCTAIFKKYTNGIKSCINHGNLWIKQESGLGDKMADNAETPKVVYYSHQLPDYPINNDTVAERNTKKKKSSRKSNLDTDLKRVGDLLKSTMDVFVNIKHEPEVQIEVDESATAKIGIEDSNDDGAETQFDSPSRSSGGRSPDDRGYQPAGIELSIKQERADDVIDATNNIENIGLNIKKELINNEDTGSEQTNKISVPKLIIKKEHGTLNSSLIGDGLNAEKKRKRKKKRDSDNMSIEESHEKSGLEMDQSTASDSPVRIKQEILDEESLHQNHAMNNEIAKNMEKNVMTSIPLAQFQISCVSGGVSFADGIDASTEAYDKGAPLVEERDIKPNIQELNKMLQISQEYNDEAANPIHRRHFNPHFFNVAIKPEPAYRGYSDEVPCNSWVRNESRLRDQMRTSALKSHAFGRLRIKQEKEVKNTETACSSNKEQSDCVATIKDEVDHDNECYEESGSSCSNADNMDNETPHDDQIQAVESEKNESSVVNEKPQSPANANNCQDAVKIIEEDSSEKHLPDDSVNKNDAKDDKNLQVEVRGANKEMEVPLQDVVIGAKEVLLMTPPLDDTRKCLDSTMNASRDIEVDSMPQGTENVTEANEEQQNILNHEAVEQSIAGEQNSPALVIPIPQTATDESSCNDTVAATCSLTSLAHKTPVLSHKVNEEEEDNLINENVDALIRQQQQQRQDLFPFALDDSNMNEIAENHNNANIERELQEENFAEIGVQEARDGSTCMNDNSNNENVC